MDRRSVFAALAAAVGLKAQIHRTDEPVPWQMLGNKPKPDQCPVCSTMAEPYKPTPDQSCGDLLVMLPDGKNVSGCDKSVLPIQNLTRCKRCNAAFWQDAKE